MTHLRTHCLRVLAIVLLAGLATFAASPGAAQEGAGTLAIYAYECPDGIPGSDFSRCHEHPLGGVGYTAVEAGQDNGVGATTGPNGDATISLGAIGGGTVNVRVSPPAGYETGYIACSQEYGAIDGGITFGNVPNDGFITCQWYFVATGGDPDPDPEPTAAPRRDQPRDEPPVSGLPATGSGPMEVLNDQPWVPTVLGIIAIGLLDAAHARWQRRRE